MHGRRWLRRKVVLPIAIACVCAAVVGAAGCARLESGPDNLILITIDTLRADHLGTYGYERDTSPSLDRVASEGTRFGRCYAQSVTTRASHASLFTGCYPRTHGVLSNIEEYPDRTSLMTVLRARGYVAAGFVSSVMLNARFGVQRQLDHFDDSATSQEVNRPNMAERSARDTLRAVLEYLDRRDRARPFFVWIHLIDPHGPYTAPENPNRFVGDAHARPGLRELPLGEGNAGFKEIPRYQILNSIRDPDYYVARYDAEIRYADDAIGAFVADLRSRDLYDRTLMVVTADHGETLDEATHRRYFSHSLIAYEEVSRIPLIVREARGARRLAAVGASKPILSIDVAPTILDLLGVDVPPDFEGRSVLRGARDENDAIFSFGSYGSPLFERQMGTQFSVRRGPWRYIRNSLDGEEEIYDHRTDPSEARNRASEAPAELSELRAMLVEFLRQPAARSPASAASDADREKLRALGYVR